MTDADALRRAVVALPDDDTPRLIYADWLDENAQADRAAFIRAQVEAARAEPFSLPARDAETRSNRLLEPNRRHWTRHLHGQVVETPRFHRGFIHHVAVEAVRFESATAEIFDLEPVQSLRIVRSDGDGEEVSLLPVFESARMRQIRQLEFTTARVGFTEDEYQAFLKAPHLNEVRTLSLRGNAIHHPSWLSELFSSEAFPQLSNFDVADITNLGPGLFIALSRCTHRSLRSLDASRVAFTSNHLQGLLASPCLQNLEELRLGFTSLGAPGPLFHLDIGWVIPWQQLAVLDLAGQRLGDDAVRALTAQQDAGALRWLSLANNELSHESVRKLVNAKHLALRHLDVRGNRFSADYIAALKERFPEGAVVG